MSLSPTPRLLIRRPSPTTVSFTVSNLPNHSRITSLLITIPILLLRSLLGVFTLFVNWAKYSSTIVEARFPLPLPITTAQNIIATTSFGRLAAVVAERIKWPVLLPISAAISYLVIARFYTEESLLVLRGLGIQTSTSSSTYLGSASTRFIPTRDIQDIFVHEAFHGWQVRFYLAVVVEGEDDVVVVFPNLLPRRRIIEKVWRGARACLYEPIAAPAGEK